jgi:hypothetical protein
MPSMRHAQVARVGAFESNCTVQRKDGTFCDAPMAPEMPFPICSHHAIKLYKRMQEVMASATQSREQQMALGGQFLGEIHERKRERDKKCVIYYVLVGTMIKIGYTEDLRARIAHYPPGTRLLAVQRGGRSEEGRLHSRFAPYRTAGNEWYRIEQPLVDHINEVRITNDKKPLRLTDLQPAV